MGLEVGADDYLGKPYNPRELLARVRALLRRSKMSSTTSRDGEVLSLGTLELNPVTHEVADQGDPLSHPYRVLPTQALYEPLPPCFESGKDLEDGVGASHLGSRRLVDTRIGNLRKKIDGSSVQIVAVRGVGFKLVAVG